MPTNIQLSPELTVPPEILTDVISDISTYIMEHTGAGALSEHFALTELRKNHPELFENGIPDVRDNGEYWNYVAMFQVTLANYVALHLTTRSCGIDFTTNK